MKDTNEHKKIQEEETEKQVQSLEDTPVTDNEAWERFVRKTVIFYLR